MTRRTCACSGRNWPQSSKQRTIATVKVVSIRSAFAYVGLLGSTPSRGGPLLSRRWSLARDNCDVFGKKSSKVLPNAVRMTGRVVGLPSGIGGGRGELGGADTGAKIGARKSKCSTTSVTPSLKTTARGVYPASRTSWGKSSNSSRRTRKEENPVDPHRQKHSLLTPLRL